MKGSETVLQGSFSSHEVITQHFFSITSFSAGLISIATIFCFSRLVVTIGSMSLLVELAKGNFWIFLATEVFVNHAHNLNMAIMYVKWFCSASANDSCITF